MKFSRSVELPFDRRTVWEGLNNPDILRDCIPGCESFEAPQPDHFDVVSVIKIGMIKARFEGAVDLTDIDAPNGYRITGAGKGGVAGYASGAATVRLDETDTGTRLHYEAEAKVGGKIAQLGSRLIDTVANQMADQFFRRFAEALERQQNRGAAAPVTATAPALAPPRQAAEARSTDWLLPYCVGLASGVLIGAFAVMALG